MKKILAPLALALALLFAAPKPSGATVVFTKTRSVTIAGGFQMVIGTLAFSGNYVTNGDTLNLAGFEVPGTVVPRAVLIYGVNGFMYSYVTGTTRANGKVEVFVATTGGANLPLSQHTAAAYVAGVTGDTVTAILIFDALR